MNNLFSSIEIKGTILKNRIVMPPMVRFDLGGGDGFVTDEHIVHYQARAKGGVGLVIVEATCVEKTARLSPHQLGLWSDDQIPGFQRIAEACHRYGTSVLVQIHHGGLNTHKDVTPALVAPSDYRGQTRGVVSSARALTVPEILNIQGEFTAAALRAKKAGLDGVELHGAHGFLISQFFSPLVNKRTDSYGGDLRNRSRFVVEIVTTMRREVGNNFIIGCRMGCNEPDIETSIEIAKILEECGIDLLHVSSGFGFMDQGLKVPTDFNYSWIVYGGTQIKKHVHVPVIVVNGIRTPEQAAYLVEQGLTDLVAVGTGQLHDPEWVKKARGHLSMH